ERPAVTQACEHFHAIGLDLLARAAAIPLLPAAQVEVDRLAVEREPGGQAGQDRDEGRPVGLAGRDERERHPAERTAARMTSTGAGTPVHSWNDAAPWRTSASSPSTTRRQPASCAAVTSAVGAPSALYGRSTTAWSARGSTSS